MSKKPSKNPVGRPRLYESKAEMQRAYRGRLEQERMALSEELEPLRLKLENEGDSASAKLVQRVQAVLRRGRTRKSD